MRVRKVLVFRWVCGSVIRGWVVVMMIVSYNVRGH